MLLRLPLKKRYNYPMNHGTRSFRFPSRYSMPGLILSIMFLVVGAMSTPGSQTPSVPAVSTPTPQQVASPSAVVQVSRVVDGDTIDVTIEGKKESIRFIGIDTPEVVDPRKLVQCFGKEASAKTKALLTGKQVTLEADASQGDRDKYNRLLRYIILDGVNINKLLITEGFAHEYTYRLPYKYQEEFRAAEAEARENKRGLWADGICPIPTAISSSPSAAGN